MDIDLLIEDDNSFDTRGRGKINLLSDGPDEGEMQDDDHFLLNDVDDERSSQI